MEKNNLTKTSKFISLILRHKPETIGKKRYITTIKNLSLYARVQFPR